MKPHPHPHRIRNTIKWGGAAVTVLLVVVWIGSGKYRYTSRAPKGDWWMVANGSVQYGRTFLGMVLPWSYTPSSGLETAEVWQVFWMSKRSDQRAGWSRSYPLWPVPVVAAAISAVAWRLDTLPRRRARLNLCPKCGYDRTGILQDAKCPECGAGGAVPASG